MDIIFHSVKRNEWAIQDDVIELNWIIKMNILKIFFNKSTKNYMVQWDGVVYYYVKIQIRYFSYYVIFNHFKYFRSFLSNKKIGYTTLRMFLGILYSLNSFQT
jgi:hypothetical protein